MNMTEQQEPIVIEYNPSMSTVEPVLKKAKIEYDDIKSEDEFNEGDNIQQIPNMEIENLFTRAFNSYTVIKQEEFKVIKQNDESMTLIPHK